MGSAGGRFGIPFTNMDRLATAIDGLHAAGYPRMGREQLYSGVTGEPLDGMAFVGSVFYQRLRHMVAPRVHLGGMDPAFGQGARPVSGAGQPTRQTTHRRARPTGRTSDRRDGTRLPRPGGPLGDRDPPDTIAHGACSLMQERLLFKSDAYRLAVCGGCGRAACHDGRQCKSCKARGLTSPDVVGVIVPYSFKLLLQEITAMGIDVRISTAPTDRSRT